MKAIERLYEYIDFKGCKPTIFEKSIGLSSGYLSVQKKRNADIGESIINKINDYCHDVSIEWLLTGKGEMLKTDTCNNVSPPPAPPESNAPHECIYKELLKEKETEIRALNREIGALGNKIEQLREAAKKSAVPYKQELISPLMAAEPEAAYIKAQQKIPTE